MSDLSETGDFLFYRGDDGSISIEVVVGQETVWTTQKGMAEIFDTDRTSITRHIQNIITEGEVDESNVQKMHIANSDKPVSFYSLEMIISVGYRVNSYKATQFRIWATKVLREYLIKGFVLDDERLKQGNRLFGQDYFKELLERIREIRASERMFYEKITDLYATSIDYDKNNPETHKFFAKVQNKLEFAITGKTSAEIIKTRVNALKPNMGLTTWKNAGREGKIQKSDVTIAKNYLTVEEIRELNTLVNSYLDYAELQVQRNKVLKMKDWAEKLDRFLEFNEYAVLEHLGHMRKDVADGFAEGEYQKFRIVQDKEYKSDFNKAIDQIKQGRLPEERDIINDKREQSEKPIALSKTKKLLTIDSLEEENKTELDDPLKGILAVGKMPKEEEK